MLFTLNKLYELGQIEQVLNVPTHTKPVISIYLKKLFIIIYNIYIN